MVGCMCTGACRVPPFMCPPVMVPGPPRLEPHGPYFHGSVQFLPVGCICPPGANKECERPDCPRKPAGKVT